MSAVSAVFWTMSMFGEAQSPKSSQLSEPVKPSWVMLPKASRNACRSMVRLPLPSSVAASSMAVNTMLVAS
jgi:hypothetical protein